jgi:hypothetical protein
MDSSQIGGPRSSDSGVLFVRSASLGCVESVGIELVFTAVVARLEAPETPGQ